LDGLLEITFGSSSSNRASCARYLALQQQRSRCTASFACSNRCVMRSWHQAPVCAVAVCPRSAGAFYMHTNCDTKAVAAGGMLGGVCWEQQQQQPLRCCRMHWRQATAFLCPHSTC
jgi:hypothetical protein